MLCTQVMNMLFALVIAQKVIETSTHRHNHLYLETHWTYCIPQSKQQM